MLEQTQRLNWEKVQNALKKGLVHLEPSIGDDIPKNEKWDYSVVLKTGHTIGANISKNGLNILKTMQTLLKRYKNENKMQKKSNKTDKSMH